MKKLIAVFLSVVLVLSLAACGGEPNNGENSNSTVGAETPTELYASERIMATSGGVDGVDDLANTYYKLTTEKKLNIAYLGGSVTNGTGGSGGYCWRTATTEWFKTNFPEAQISDVNAGWGGTGSYWGFFRMDNDVLAHSPDLVFIEFSINDAYAGHTQMRSTVYMEGIVSKLRKANPKVDIVIVFVTDKSSQGTEHTNILAHKAVAAHYGIPTINVGDALVAEMKNTGNGWEYYVEDIVHPNNKGYKVYADCVAEYLKDWLVTNPNKSGLNDHKEPANELVSNLSVQSEIVVAEELTNYTGFTLINSKSNLVSHVGQTLYGAEGSTMEFEFEGRGLGMLVDGEKLPTVKITVDNKETVEIKFTDSKSECPVLDNLNYGKHTVKIEVVSGSKIVIGGFLVAK